MNKLTNKTRHGCRGHLALRPLAWALAGALAGLNAQAAPFPGMGVDKFRSEAAFKIIFLSGGQSEAFSLRERREEITLDHDNDPGTPPVTLNCIDLDGNGVPECFDYDGDGDLDDIDELDADGDGDPDTGKTFVGRSDPFTEGEEPGIFPVPIDLETGDPAPGENIAFDPAKVSATSESDLCFFPSFYPEDPPGSGPSTPDRREVHTELLWLDLTNDTGTISVRAGQAFYNSAQSFNPAVQQFFYQNSFGEVASLDPSGNPANDFPAVSAFNVFVEVETAIGRLYNLHPMVLGLIRLEAFPPFVNFPTGMYIHDPNFRPVPLYDSSGVHRAWLASAGHGAPSTGQTLPPVTVRVTIAVSVSVSITVDVTTVGRAAGPAPNHIHEDNGAAVQQITVYESSGSAVGGPPMRPDETNARVAALVGGGFAAGDAISSISYGRDGTVNASTGRSTPGVLFFSVDRAAEGEQCTDVHFNHLRDRQAGALYAAGLDLTFGLHPNPEVPFASSLMEHFMVVDATALGLRPVIGDTGQDNVAGLEVGRFNPPADRLYATFTGPTFTDNTASVFLDDPADGLSPDTLRRYARAEHLGLQRDDVIDGLILSDVTPRSVLYADRVVENTPVSPPSMAADERAEDILGAPEGNALAIGKVEFDNVGADPGAVTVGFSTRPARNGPGADLRIHGFDFDVEAGVCDLAGTGLCVGGGRAGLACTIDDENPVTGCPDINEGFEVLASADGVTFASLGTFDPGVPAAAAYTVDVDLGPLAVARFVRLLNLRTDDGRDDDEEGPELDAVEALNFAAPPPAPTRDGIRTPGDELLFSLAGCSPTLLGADGAPGVAGVDDDGNGTADDCTETGLGDDLSPATVFLSSLDGSFGPIIDHDSLGLLANDELNALDIRPTPDVRRITQLHSVGPIPNRVEVGDIATLTAVVQSNATGVPDRSVLVRAVVGDVAILNGTATSAGQRVLTGLNGDVTLVFRGNSPGPALFQITVPGTTFQSFVYAQIVP